MMFSIPYNPTNGDQIMEIKSWLIEKLGIDNPIYWTGYDWYISNEYLYWVICIKNEQVATEFALRFL